METSWEHETQNRGLAPVQPDPVGFKPRWHFSLTPARITMAPHVTFVIHGGGFAVSRTALICGSEDVLPGHLRSPTGGWNAQADDGYSFTVR
jgi:hypothetical protein